MGIFAVCLVVSFSAYQLTTYGSVRDVIGSISTQPSQVVNLHAQYNEMSDQFASASGSSYTYHFAGQSVPINASQVRGKNEQQTLSLVLDKYTYDFYYGTNPGLLGTLSGLFGAGANGLYLLISVFLFILFASILGLAFAMQWYDTVKDLLKSTGKVIGILGIVAFFIIILMPSLVNSFMWQSINSSDLARDISMVLEPLITNTFLVNMLIIVLLGALLYGIGFLIHINTGEEVSEESSYERSAPKQKSRAVVREDNQGPGRPGHKQL